jgi:hypothetical protein
VTFEYTLRMKGEPLVLDQDNLPTTSAIVSAFGGSGALSSRVASCRGRLHPFPRALKGCFYPRHLSAGRVVDWGMPYPVICVVRVLMPPRALGWDGGNGGSLSGSIWEMISGITWRNSTATIRPFGSGC